MSARVNGLTLVISTDGIDPSASPKIYFDGTNAIASSCYSVPIHCASWDVIGVQLSCPSTGTPSGTIAFQGSNDPGVYEYSTVQPDATIVNWSAVSFLDHATGTRLESKTVSGAQSYLFQFNPCDFRWLRAVWTNTSGSALLTLRAQERSVAH